MNQDLINLLLLEIKSKNQISELEDEYILNKLNSYFLTNGNIRKKLELEYIEKKEKILKSKNFKEIVKIIRKDIGIVYGSFLTSDFTKKEKLLENTKSKEEILELLKLHKSTRERVNYYEEIYAQIFAWYMPKQGICDLACGLNPISYVIFESKFKKNFSFFTSDLNPKDMNYLNSFFKKFKLNGVAKSYDITLLNFLEDENFKTCDLVFLFKALDSFESAKKNISKEILEKLPQKHIVVSFPTKSLVSKEEFKIEKRNWLFNFIEKKGWNYEQFEVENEIFLLISKNS